VGLRENKLEWLIGKRLIMKVVVLFPVAVLVLAPPDIAEGQEGCARTVQDINHLAATIGSEANSYWSYRKEFVKAKDIKNAEQERAKAGALKAGMPNRLASLKGLLKAAEAQKCLSADQLSAIREPAHNLAKAVNIDQFPTAATPTEQMNKQTPTRMPSRAPSK
jgi:hypothetical protein